MAEDSRLPYHGGYEILTQVVSSDNDSRRYERPFASRGTMKFSVGKKIAVAFGLALAALVVINLVSYRNITELNSDARWVSHTQEVLQRLESLYAGLLEAQGSGRGYELLAQASFREAFKTASTKINQELRALRTLTADNPDQQQRLDKLEPMIPSRLEISQKLMDLRDSTGAGSGTQVTSLVQEGQGMTEDIHGLILKMEDE